MVSRFTWYQLATNDLDAAIDFYAEVIGWTASEAPQGDKRCFLLSTAGSSVAGAMELAEDMSALGVRPGWLGYIEVADANARAGAIAAAGGSVLLPPNDISDVGRVALVADPGGALFYLLVPAKFGRVGPPPLPHAHTPGRFRWHELSSTLGRQMAFDFYADQFGWETVTEIDMGPTGIYRIIGDGEMQFGGIMDCPLDMEGSAWTFYVSVASIDAAAERIRENGGTVLMGPEIVPDGSWIIQAADPQGATFALVAPVR